MEGLKRVPESQVEVPFFSDAYIRETSGSASDAAIRRVVSAAQYIRGRECQQFEEEFSEYCGGTHCVGVGSGLDALALALRALGVGTGDSVIVPDHTFIATWLAANVVGARPVGAAVDSRDYVMHLDDWGDVAGDDTRAVIPVHLYGRKCEVSIPLMHAGRRMFVVEDCAQSHGVSRLSLNSHPVDALAFSFYPTKNLGAIGDAGCIVTRDAGLADAVRELGDYGSPSKYEHTRLGVNSRMDEIQAAVLRAKLPHLDHWNALRREAAIQYVNGLRDLPIQLPVILPPDEHAWHLFVIQTPYRDELREWLRNNGIQTGIHYPKPPALQLAYQGQVLGAKSETVRMSHRLLSLPLWPGISEGDIRKVVSAMGEFFVRHQESDSSRAHA